MEIESARWNRRVSDGRLLASQTGLEATIDWDEIEKKRTLDELDSTNAIIIDDTPLKSGATAGTTITLRKLRRAWSSAQHARFLEEVQAFEAPSALTSRIPARVVPHELLFPTPKLRDVQDATGNTFSVRLEGELAPPEDFWAAMIDATHWIIEVDANRQTGMVRFAIAPTALTLRKYPRAEIRTFEIEHPSRKHGPFFQARILKRTGAQLGRADLKQWAGRSSGIRVYMEGFRILPYGEARNDWLSIDRDATERDRGVLERNLPSHLHTQLQDDEDEDIGLLIVPNKHYFGGVFLTDRGAPTLEMLVNREGFVPNEDYEILVQLVRTSVDLCTRVQAAATKESRHERRELRASQRPFDDTSRPQIAPISLAMESTVEEAKQYAARAKRLVSGGRIDAASRELEQAVARVERIASASEEIVDENAMVRVLASVGTQLASFIHEINGLLDIARGVDQR